MCWSDEHPLNLLVWTTEEKRSWFTVQEKSWEEWIFSISKSARDRLPLGHAARSFVHTPLGKISPPCWAHFLSSTGTVHLAPAFAACLNFVCFSLKRSFTVCSLPKQIYCAFCDKVAEQNAFLSQDVRTRLSCPQVHSELPLTTNM